MTCLKRPHLWNNKLVPKRTLFETLKMKFYSNLLILLFLFLPTINLAQSSIPPKDWKKFEKCGFTFFAPKTVKEQKSIGIDSCIGVFSNKEVLILIDSGWYSGKFKKDNNKLEFIEEAVEINSKMGQLATYYDNRIEPTLDKYKKYIAGLHIEGGEELKEIRPNGPRIVIRKDSLKMVILVANKKDLEKVKQIFTTIKFQK
jgi:hypothetical protein